MKEIKCKKCESCDCSKAGFVNRKQRYKCRQCLSLFLPGKPKRYNHRKRLQLVRLHNEGNGIRSIARLLGISHTTAVRWIKEMAKKLKPIIPLYAKRIEIDELYFYLGNKKRRRWLWLAICRDTKRILGFCVGGRDEKTLAKLMYRLSCIQCERCYTDCHAPFAKVIPKEKHRFYPNQTNTIEGINSAVRHYLARFRRKSKCYSKSILMVEASITLLMYRLNNKPISPRI